ncbi:MAG TPA: hypothetical protein VHD56_03610 [Tepidisphaeraceae bacterium]|nr:hypothetical protein [Tepidisphaeraceae bacterium]
MRWLVHGKLSSAVGEALRKRGDTVTEAPEASAGEVIELANKQQFDIMTNDAELVRMPFEQGAKFARSIVFLQLAGEEVEQDDAIDRLFERYKRLSTGRLYTVTATRVKVRQLPD